MKSEMWEAVIRLGPTEKQNVGVSGFRFFKVLEKSSPCMTVVFSF